MRELNLATTTSIGSNYVGEDAGEYIGAAFKEADTIAKGFVTVLADIPFQIHLKKIQYSNGRQDYSCGFDPGGDLTLSEKTLTPKKIKNDFEICKEDLRQIWSSSTMGFSAHNDNLPADVESALMTEMLDELSENTDREIWQGINATSGQFGGYIEQFDADANIIKAGSGITSLSGAVTKSNVLSEVEKVLDAIPIALRRKLDLNFMVSPDIGNFYMQALIGAGVTNGHGGGDFPLTYGQTTLEIVNGLPDNTFVVAQSKNLVFGTGLMNDFQSIRMKDMDESDLSGQVRVKYVYTAGVNFYNSNEIVWYLTTT